MFIFRHKLEFKIRFNMFFIFLFLIHFSFILFSYPAVSQESSVNVQQFKLENSESLNNFDVYHTSFDGELRMEGLHYPKPISGKPQLSSNLLVSSKFQLKMENQHSYNGFDFSVGRDLDSQHSEFILRELYTAIPIKSVIETDSLDHQSYVAIGRKIEFWSEVDSNWDLGIWQPYTSIDALRPQRQGLLGLFLRLQNEWLDFLAFATPYFVPTMGPEVKEKNGSLEADSRWYRSPSSSFPINGKETRLVYSLDVPEISKLVENPGRGFRLRLGEEQGAWMSTSYGYKPINSLVLKYKSKLFLPEKDPNTGEITIQPDVLYHEVMGTDFGYQDTDWNFSVSYLHDRPYPGQADPGWVMQSPEGLSAQSIHLELNSELLAELDWVQKYFYSLKFSVDYLQVTGGRIHDFDSTGQETGAIFEQRLNFLNALQMKLKKDATLWGRSFQSQIKYLREYEQHGTLWGLEFQYFPKKQWALVVGADALGVDDDRDENTDSRFLNQFRANDRVYGGVNYVF